jgi:hypothetical protein
MPPLRARTRKSRSATSASRLTVKQTPSIVHIDSATGRYGATVPAPASLSKSAQAAPMLDAIAVAAVFAPVPVPVPASPPALAPSPSSSLVPHAVGTLDVTTDVRNQAAIAEALIMANHMLESNRAENTKKAYLPKKKLWTTWCRNRGFSDGETVTEGKLCLWLQEEVFVNGSQARGGRKGSMLSPQGVEGYIKPVIELYEVRLHYRRAFD